MKMPLKNSTERTVARKPPDPNRCAFETSDGRRCRLPRFSGHATLCVFHSREELQLLESRNLGAELAASLSGHFMTATDINHVLGKLFTALAQNRIPARNAHTLAYIGHLMLLSLPGLKREFPFAYSFDTWMKHYRSAIQLSDSTPESAVNNENGNDSAADEGQQGDSTAEVSGDSPVRTSRKPTASPIPPKTLPKDPDPTCAPS